ncbi:MAG: hypothetical protein EZS28_056294 [Streblomastix strix]|uniref:Uncharacterized protein n=1 Tax=Streblomastix strix TaxID=222440 RepID=A0A5J4PLU4_9EUKA|nr:MAG: hypothetical protein EZS28_056294 [Streblomastix strix]
MINLDYTKRPTVKELLESETMQLVGMFEKSKEQKESEQKEFEQEKEQMNKKVNELELKVSINLKIINQRFCKNSPQEPEILKMILIHI